MAGAFRWLGECTAVLEEEEVPMRPATISILIALVATSASAQPKQEDSNERVGIAAHKPKLRPESTGWIELASPTPVKYGTTFILTGKTRSFSQLRIDATGKVIVSRIRLSFADGTARNIQLGRTLDPKRPSTVIDLPAGKPIVSIAVTTAWYTRGMYTLHGSSGGSVAKR